MMVVGYVETFWCDENVLYDEGITSCKVHPFVKIVKLKFLFLNICKYYQTPKKNCKSNTDNN